MGKNQCPLVISFAVFHPYWRLAHESATATSMPVR
jgi:hypothetical protein